MRRYIVAALYLMKICIYGKSSIRVSSIIAPSASSLIPIELEILVSPCGVSVLLVLVLFEAVMQIRG